MGAMDPVHLLVRAARVLAPLAAGPAVLIGLLACSEHELVPKPPIDEDTDVDVIVGDTDAPDDVVLPPDIPPPPPAEPVADAGPDRVWATGDLVDLDGSASYDPQGLEPLTWIWTLTGFPNGSSVQIAGLDTVAPTFTADVAGEFTFDLTVQNSAGVQDSTPASVTITVEDEPVLEPIAVAGPDQTREQGALVALDGTGSFDPQGLTPLSYTWQIVQRPTGSTVTLSDRFSPTPSFTSDIAGTYAIQLSVTNSAGVADSTPDQVEITAYPVVLPPISNAGVDQSGTVGTAVTLNGSGSTDPQGLIPLTYAWVWTMRPPGSTADFSNPSIVNPTFTPDVPGHYTAELGVRNTANLWDPTPDKVDIIVTQIFVQEPVANAGADFGVLPLEYVELDGSASYDPAGLTPLTYAWTMVSSPAGSTATLSYASSAHPEFFADLAGAYVFTLAVQNSAGVWDSTPDTVTVEALPIDGFYVEVSWDNEPDLDLHVLNGASAMWSDGDACYCNTNPDWGGPGAADDPELDYDAIYGYGPETTTIDAPANGSYKILVHYYGLNGSSSCSGFSCPSTTATANIYLGGNLAQTFTQVMTSDDQVWNVATISWPSGQITPHGNITTTTQTYCN